MMAWDRFQGRWLIGEEFSYPERPENMPTMKEVSRPAAWNEKPPDLGRCHIVTALLVVVSA